MNEATLAALTEEQRGWVLQAAADAVKASVEGSFDESPVATELCEAGLRFVAADEGQLEALREAVQPVIDGLASSEKSGALLDDIQAIAAAHPGVDQPLVPAECQGAAPPDVPAAIADTLSDIPDGTYRQEVRLEDVQAAGLTNDAGWTGTWTLLVSDGTYRVTCRFVADPGRDCGNSRAEDLVLEAGHLRGEGDRVTFLADAEVLRGFTECQPEACFVPEPYHATWSFEDGQLTFSEIDEWAAGFAVAPWSRID
jgi:hypothetical protein